MLFTRAGRCSWTLQVCTREVELWSAVDRDCSCCWPWEDGRLDLSHSCPSYGRRSRDGRSVAIPSRSCVVTASTDWMSTGSFRVHVAVNRKTSNSSRCSSKFANWFSHRVICVMSSAFQAFSLLFYVSVFSVTFHYARAASLSWKWELGPLTFTLVIALSHFILGYMSNIV